MGDELAFMTGQIELASGIKKGASNILAGILQSEDGKGTTIAYEVIVDNALQEVIKYQVTEVKDRQSKVLHTFQQEMPGVPGIDWGGVHCDWVSAILCAHHCFLWSAGGVIAVGICETLCFATFVFVCNW
ncbi:MAG: hypothetical protein WCC10_03730 [Tumebacillaceae bacterium]